MFQRDFNFERISATNDIERYSKRKMPDTLFCTCGKGYRRTMMTSRASLNVSPIFEFSRLLDGTAASEQVNGG
jgi:hypothetical protein